MPGRLVRREGGGGWMRTAANVGSAIAGYATRKYIKSRAKPTKSDQSTAVTRQTDFRVRYSKKKGNKKGYKKAARFRNKVLSVLRKDQNPQWFNFQQRGSVACVTGEQKIFQMGTLMSWTGLETDGNGDLASAYTAIDPVYFASTNAGVQVPVRPRDYSKLHVKTSHMEVDVVNTGILDAILDVYEVYCRRDTVGFATLDSMFNLTPNYWVGNSSSGQATAVTLGMTPFQMDDVTSCFKIGNKATYNLPAGANASIQMHGPRNKTIYGAVMAKSIGDGSTCFGRRGMTRSYIGIVRGKCGALGATGAATLTFNARKTYNLAVATNTYGDTITQRGN